MNVEDLIQGHEGPRLEFKENINSAEAIINTIIAFANGAGGKLVIGVNDKTRYIIGVADPHKSSEALSNKIYDIIEPRVLPNIEVIPYRNTYLLVIEVYPSVLRPHFKRKEGKEKSTYLRLGSTTRLADETLLKAIERSTVTKYFDEELCYAANCEEIDFTAASQLLKHKLKLTNADLVSLGVISKHGDELIPTVGGILLFGKNRLNYFPDAYIQVGVFNGNSKDKILNSQKITSFLPNTVEEALEFLRKNIRVGIAIEEIRHQEVWEIPKIALREALVNAIVHSDYSLAGAPIRIAIFNDRIEIENTALLLWGLSFEDLKAGISKLRNPVIARVFHEIGLIEQWGSGITRMINVCQDAGLAPPIFEAIGPRIRVTFYKEKISKLNIDEVDKFITLLFLNWGALSTSQIAVSLKKSRRSVIQRLTNLVNKGRVVEISHGLNDPKKKYTLKTEEKTITSNIITKADFDNRRIENTKWSVEDIASDNLMTIRRTVLNICYILGAHKAYLIFSEDDVGNFFLLYDNIGGRSKWQERAVEEVKHIIFSEAVFNNIFLEKLATKKVQEDLGNSNTATINLVAEDWNFKDFRNTQLHNKSNKAK